MRSRGTMVTLVVAALAAAGLVVAGPAGPARATSLDATEASLITQSGRIVDAYSSLGITEADIPTATTADVATLESIVDLTSGPTATPTLPASRPTDCSNTGALVSYARDVAQMNIDRGDTHAQSLDDETVYMYMSHFFDLPSMCADPTAYYPDWITDSDRTAYTNYLTATNNVQLAASTGQLVISVSTLATSASTVKDVIAQGGLKNISEVITMLDLGEAGDTVKTEFPKFSSAVS